MSKDEYYLTPKSPSSRPLKVGEALRKALAEIFMRGETHVLALDSASITVSEVRVAPDLKNATAFVMPLAGSNQETILEALKECAPYIRHLLTKKVELRYMPRIVYKLDASFDEANRINQLLHSDAVVKKDSGDGD